MKRFIALAVAAVLTFFTFTSCSGEQISLLEFIDDGDSNVRDLSNETITILDEQDNIFDIKENTTLYDLVLARMDEIEKKYNCTLERKVITNDYTEYVTSNFFSSKSPADIIFSKSSGSYVFAAAGFLYPLTELQDYLNYEDSEKFGAPGLLEAAMVDGIPYGVQPVQWPGFYVTSSFLLVYNKDMVSEQGLTDLHEFYEAETWTWDNFLGIIDAFDVGADSSTYALSAAERAMAPLVLRSNGVKFASYSDGQVTSDFTETKSVKALQWYQQLYKDYGHKILNVPYWDITAFTNEKSFMTVASGEQVISSDLQYDSSVVFGLMPFPSGPDAVYGEWAQWCEHLMGFSISSLTNHPEACAEIISDLCEPFDEFGGSDGPSSYLTEQVFQDEIDTEIFINVGKYIRYDYWRCEDNLLEFFVEFSESYKSRTAMEFIEKYEPEISALVENTIKPNYENYIYDHLYK